MSKLIVSAVGYKFETDAVTLNAAGELEFNTVGKDGVFKMTLKTTDYIIQERIGDAPKTASLIL